MDAAGEEHDPAWMCLHFCPGPQGPGWPHSPGDMVVPHAQGRAFLAASRNTDTTQLGALPRGSLYFLPMREGLAQLASTCSLVLLRDSSHQPLGGRPGVRTAPGQRQDSEVMLDLPPGGAMIFCAVRRAMWSSACDPGESREQGSPTALNATTTKHFLRKYNNFIICLSGLSMSIAHFGMAVFA